MKKIIFHLSWMAIVTVSILFAACRKDVLETTYTYFEPVMALKTDVLASIKSTAPQPLQQTGKIVKYGQTLLINELNKGVHIIDNSNPAKPVNKHFISIPGNIDIAIKGSALYADIYTDMVVVDISDPDHATLRKVVSSVFPERKYSTAASADSLHYIVDWKKKTTQNKEELENLKNNPGPVIFNMPGSMSIASAAAIGVTGSMARFTIVNNYLYTVGTHNLTSFNIASSFLPTRENTQTIGWDIETIYPFKNNLFIGGQTGMNIFNLNNPAQPAFTGNFAHACLRDPVIADDNYAYVTLRENANPGGCRGTQAEQRNELNIVGISNMNAPTLVKKYDMVAPQGLSKDGDILFICDNAGGLKIYNAADPINLQLIKKVGNVKPFDVIAQNGLAIVVAEGGLYQYNYANLNNITLVSKIAITK